jgi:hypothetical protein
MALVLTRTQNLGPMPTPHPSARTSSHRASRVRQIGARAHLRGWARRNITEYGSPGGRVWGSRLSCESSALALRKTLRWVHAVDGQLFSLPFVYLVVALSRDGTHGSCARPSEHPFQ